MGVEDRDHAVDAATSLEGCELNFAESVVAMGGRKAIDGGLTISFFREHRSLTLYTMVRLGFKQQGYHVD